MIDYARKMMLKQHRCQFVVNSQPNLQIFRDDYFDFVLSVLVLQHMLPDLSCSYISEFLRVLKPGALAYFQIPARSLSNAKELESTLFTPNNLESLIDMYGMNPNEVETIVENSRGNLIHRFGAKDESIGFENYTYLVSKRDD